MTRTTVNNVLINYPRTALEIAAGVTPVDYSYPYGNLYRYGAVGDGVADDTTALSNWAKLSGRLTGVGTFNTTEIVHLLQDNTTIDGYGMKVVSNTANLRTVFEAEGLTGIQIIGVEIDGKKSLKTPAPVSASYGIHLLYCTRSLIRDCYIYDTVEHGIRIGLIAAEVLDESPIVKVVNNTLENCGNDVRGRGWGIWCFGYVRGLVISGNICKDNRDGGIFVDDSSADQTPDLECLRLSITGNVVEASSYAPAPVGASSGIGVEGSRYFSITGNTASGYQRGITVSSGQARSQSGFGAVTGNTAVGERRALNISNAQYVNISGNTFQHTDASNSDNCAVSITGDDVSTPGSHVKFVRVANNLILCARNGVLIETIGTPAESAEEVSIVDNEIVYVGTVAGNGVNVGTTVGNIAVKGNAISGGFSNGVYFSATTPGYVENNRIRGCTQYGIRVANATFNLVARNTCWENAADVRIESSANLRTTYLKDNELLSTTSTSGSQSSITTSGNFGNFEQQVFPMDRVSDTLIASAAASVNTTGKFIGKMIWDVSNKRVMFALGSSPTSEWEICDGSGSVTPS